MPVQNESDRRGVGVCSRVNEEESALAGDEDSKIKGGSRPAVSYIGRYEGGELAEGGRIQAFRPEHGGFKAKNSTSGQICRLPFGVLSTRIQPEYFPELKTIR